MARTPALAQAIVFDRRAQLSSANSCKALPAERYLTLGGRSHL
jgi:hypothetical protein